MTMLDQLEPPGIEEISRCAGDHDGIALLEVLLKGPLANRVALVSSFGAESAVLLDMVATVDRKTPIIFLQTGKLFPETLDHQRSISAYLGLEDVRIVEPETHGLKRYDPGGNLWQAEPDLCCHIRKTEPLERALSGFDAWINGRKRYQGGLRSDLPTLEIDQATQRVKINPLARWSLEDIRHYRRLRQLPLHPLVTRGFTSIGCAPCTKPVQDRQAGTRDGRWAGLDKVECGIHGATRRALG